MRFIFHPGIRLMRQFKLFPKFCILTAIFLIPSLLMAGLLVYELHRSIELAQREQQGLSQLNTLDGLAQKIAEHRAWSYLAKAGNAAAATQTVTIGKAIENDFAIALAQISSSKYAQTASLLSNTKAEWDQLVSKDATSKAVDSYRSQSQLLHQLDQVRHRLSDEAGLSLDPQVDTSYLAQVLLRSLPELRASLSDTVARGAPYIDTGLMQANDDVLINANLLLLQRDQNKLMDIIKSAADQDHKLDAVQQHLQTLIDQQSGFNERTRNEILNTLQQTSSSDYLHAGLQQLHKWHAWSAEISTLMDLALQQRLKDAVMHRNLVVLMVSAVIIIALYLLICFYLSFAAQVVRLRSIARDISRGNLSVDASNEDRDELAILQNDFDQMRIMLIQLISHLRQTSIRLDHATEEIASGNMDLSNRTEQQSQVVSRAAHSMTLLSEEIDNNAQHAQLASQQTHLSNDKALALGRVTEDLAATMNLIQSSSQQIHDIISVIDGIAFQTNILALNAAVEAARAGDQGRGFAVVAAEVRALAQRSAAAAKEIKQLISSSVDHTNAGHAQVQQTRGTVQHMLQQIETVAQHMSELALASASQTEEIRKMNNSLKQIDSFTQQNSALVEEAAAASASVKTEVRGLIEAFAVFQIEASSIEASPTKKKSKADSQAPSFKPRLPMPQK